MAERKVYFQPGEWFHCFNRGVEKRKIFMEQSDYSRFLSLLYACNSVEPIHVSNYEQGSRSMKLSSVLKIPRKALLVDIGAYTLMPNHFHFLLKEKIDGGLSTFMRKIGTAYAMYFNIKYVRSGALYQGVFKAKHVRTDSYFDRLLNYIHGNHVELKAPDWKRGVIKSRPSLEKFLTTYPYSSLRDYSGNPRAESTIINAGAVFDVIDKIPPPRKILDDARVFARQHDEF